MKKTPKLSSLIDKAVFDYSLIEPGDRILVGASGGKDSTALIEYLADRSKRPNCNFEYLALNIQSDFAPSLPDNIINFFSMKAVPLVTLKVNITERVKPNQKMSCYWCATQRRTELLNYAIEHGYNKIALGHHMDDMLETLLMNMLNKSELSTMPPKLKYENFPVTIIRPLCYVTEERIINHAKEQGYFGFTCTCSYQDNSIRKEARVLLEKLTDGNTDKKEKLFNSLKNIQKDYLP